MKGVKSVLVTLNLLFLIILPPFVNPSKSAPNLVSNILHDEYFSSCEIIFVTVPEVITHNGASNITHNSLSRLPYGESWGSSGIYSVTRLPTNPKEIVKFRRLEDIHRFNSRQCGVVFSSISQVAPDLPKWLFDNITPPYVPIIRKDEDHFVFIFKNQRDAEKLLFSREFGSKIRFKIALLSPAANEIPVIQTVYLYGNMGQPVINPIRMRVSGATSLFPDSTRNFNGHQLRVANPKASSHFEMAPLPNRKGNRAVRGIYKVWLDVMMERFNFTVDLFLSSYFGGTGKQLINGTWLGAVADVLYDRADIASFNGHIYNRHTVVEWSAPVTYEWMAFVTHKPVTFYSATALCKPFPVILWAGFLLSILLVCLMLKFLVNMNPDSKWHVPFYKTVMYLAATCMEEGASYYIYSVLHLSSIRLMVVFWLLFAMIISTAYRGKLVSLIAFPALSWVPTNFEELAYSDYRVGLNTLGKGGAVYSVLSTSNSPVYQSIFNRLEIFPDSAKCLREALHHDFGCIMVKSIGDVVAAKNFTDKFGRSPFKVSDRMALFHADGYIWEKKAVFRQHFDSLTWSIMETGLHDRWFKTDLDSLKQKRLAWEREAGTKSSLSTDLNEGPAKLKVAHLMGIFYISLVGLGLGLIFFIGEIFQQKYLVHQLSKPAAGTKIQIRNTISEQNKFHNQPSKVISAA